MIVMDDLIVVSVVRDYPLYSDLVANNTFFASAKFADLTIGLTTNIFQYVIILFLMIMIIPKRHGLFFVMKIGNFCPLLRINWSARTKTAFMVR